MRYGPSFDLNRLPPEGRELLIVLIARELTAPSRSSSQRYGIFYGMSPDNPQVLDMAQRIAVYPESGMNAAMRADCIHAVFGVLEYATLRGLPRRHPDELLRSQGPERDGR